MFKFLNVCFYLGLKLFFMFMTLILLGLYMYIKDYVVFLEWEIFSFSGLEFIMVFLLDWMSLSFSGFVMLISSMVLMYSFYYMHGDKYIIRFILLVYLFVFSMLLMILSPNLMSILLGWDGLGLVSYCLVIYYQGVKSANAGMLTILSNRVGDVAILLGIAWLFSFGSWNFFYTQYLYLSDKLLFLVILVILAAMTKSAQIPFSAWLPAAMAAPTPVSALVHSSTLVTAGVYLMIRFSYMLGMNNFLLFIGVLTMFMSGLGANYEMDLKKIIALSTLSQLGVMMFVLSLGFEDLAFFHLLSHALFKSLLFLCAGVFIHGVGDAQDIRYFGGVSNLMPLSSFFFVCCSLSLSGFPFLAGFYSKDLILETFMLGHMNFFLMFIVFIGTFFTVTYSMRLGGILFFKNLGKKFFCNFGENVGMLFPMFLLFFISVFAGSFMSWIYFPIYGVFLEYLFKLIFLIFLFILIFFVYLMMFTSNWFKILGYLTSCQYFFSLMWFMPFISTFFMMNFLKLGNTIIKYLDQGWLEMLGGQGVILMLGSKGLKLDRSLFFMPGVYMLMGIMIIVLMIVYI